MSNKMIDIKDKQFGEWTALEYIGNSMWKCKCSCGTIKNIRSSDLRNGKSSNCGHNRLIELKNKKFGEWTVIKYSGNGKWICRCSCGVEREVYGSVLRAGTSKSCGHTNYIDIKGQQFGEWTVLEYIGNSIWKCQCSCGTIKNIHSQSLRTGNSKSCGHINCNKNMIGKTFGEWEVLEYIGNSQFKCRCSCGKESNVFRMNLIYNRSKSCGHDRIERIHKAIRESGETSSTRMLNPRLKWQIDVLSTRDNFYKYLIKFDKKPTAKELSLKLDTDKNVILRKIHEFELEDFIEILELQSDYEKDIVGYIRSIYDGVVIEKDRKEITPKELDIYIPDKKIAIEFNGNYWHSTINKDKYYHQNKTLDCYKKGIHLIHIFEYEWVKNNDNIKKLLYDLICGVKKIYARNTKLIYINKNTAENFFKDNHIDGWANSEINIGLEYNDELMSVISFGKPRFNNDYDYEIIRYATKFGYCIVGGLSKLINSFMKNYNKPSIITYVDISKFSGNGYIKAGFKLTNNPITKPNYIWVDKYNNKLSRYQTQKHKLLDKGFGTLEQTEDQIMGDLGYYKIYNSGNLRLEWHK